MASVAEIVVDGVVVADTRVEVVRSKERFLALAGQWDALALTAGNALALHDWYAATLEAFGERVRLHAVLVWRDGELAAAVPLAAPAVRPPRLCPLDAFLGEPDRLLYRDAHALRALAKAIVGLNMPIAIRRLPTEAEIDAALPAGWKSRAVIVRKNTRQSAFVDIPGSFREFEASMSSKRKSTLRRKKRAAEKEGGPVRTELVVPDPDEIEAPIGRLLRIEARGWKGRGGTSMEADPRFQRFIPELVRRFARTGACRIAFLRIGDCDAAGRLMLEHRATWYEIKIGYDERFARYSPGLLLMHEIFGLACEQGVRRYEFLGLSESWQSFWPHRVRRDEFLAIYPYNVRGLAAFVDDALTMTRRMVGRGGARFAEWLRKRGEDARIS